MAVLVCIEDLSVVVVFACNWWRICAMVEHCKGTLGFTEVGERALVLKSV
jgi:hypothetical protein